MYESKEWFADGVTVAFSYSPVVVLAVTKDGEPYDGPVRRPERTAFAACRWYLYHLEVALGDRLVW